MSHDEILQDLTVSLVYQVERDLLPRDGGCWQLWSASKYATRRDALSLADRVSQVYRIPRAHLRVIRVTVEVVG